MRSKVVPLEKYESAAPGEQIQLRRALRAAG